MEYSYYQGDFYVAAQGQWVVVKAPTGARVPYVPDAATEKEVGGKKYYNYEDVWFVAKSKDGDTVYEVTDDPT